MERKRKLPARAAARSDHVAKKRTVTPPKDRSPTPAPAQPAAEEPVTVQLPTSVQSGKALPTVDNAQSDDLPSREFQSVQESGVLAESIQRSRNRWIAEGLFEKYWTKPTKRKGVVSEDPKNPSKDTMTKVGAVIITIEPHVFDATMFAIRDPKPPPPPPPPPSHASAVFRPIMQYGPPNGVMPPPATPLPTPPPKSATPAASTVPDSRSSRPSTPQISAAPSPTAAKQELPAPSSAARAEATPKISSSPKPTPAPVSQPMSQTASAQSAPGGPSPAIPHATSTTQPLPRQPTPSPRVAMSPATHVSGASVPGTPGAPSMSKPPASNDPIISTLAAKAATDPYLRDIMKRVAGGCAKPDEMAHFQSVIEEISLEYKKKGGAQGPAVDKIMVDGKSIKYYADEVRSIVEVVLMSNPKQRSGDLRVPRGSNPLVIALVQTALDDNRTRETIRRIADGKHLFTDPSDLKAVLDKLKKSIPPPPPKSSSLAQSPQMANGAANGGRGAAPSPSPASSAQQNNHQALRSKGPPPSPPPSSLQPQPSAMALEFLSGNGDRYLFPKFSILEYAPGGSNQVVASFFIVRKGSTSEYGGDPALDYYQPVTIRISGRGLEHLARVVAPQEEVRRYMDDVMDNMTRAEYVILAMRLPRTPREMAEGAGDGTTSQQQLRDSEEPGHKPGSGTGKSTARLEPEILHPLRPQNPGVLWTAKAGKSGSGENQRRSKGADGDHDKQAEYRKFIHSVTAKDNETA